MSGSIINLSVGGFTLHMAKHIQSITRVFVDDVAAVGADLFTAAVANSLFICARATGGWRVGRALGNDTMARANYSGIECSRRSEIGALVPRTSDSLTRSSCRRVSKQAPRRGRVQLSWAAQVSSGSAEERSSEYSYANHVSIILYS